MERGGEEEGGEEKGRIPLRKNLATGLNLTRVILVLLALVWGLVSCVYLCVYCVILGVVGLIVSTIAKL